MFQVVVLWSDGDPSLGSKLLVVVHRVCLDSWWSYGGFSRQVNCTGVVCHRLLL